MTEPWENPFQSDRLNHFADFRPRCDVPSLHGSTARALLDAIRRPGAGVLPNLGQKVRVLLGDSGLGKTHVLARVAHALGDEALTAYVPAFDDPSRPLGHLQWHVAEAFCQRMSSGLAKVQISDAASASTIPLVVLESLTQGQATTCAVARRWLRGDSLSELETRRLGLPDEPPSSGDVIRGVQAILGPNVPLVICCDQFEQFLRGKPETVTANTKALLAVLDEVPNLILVLSCLEPQWSNAQATLSPEFRQRLDEPCRLGAMSELQAVELVGKRLSAATWRHDATTLRWPFDEAALLQYLMEKQPTPRLLLTACKNALVRWLDSDRSESIVLTDHEAGDLPRLFLEHWNEELETVKADANCQPGNIPEVRLFRAVGELLLVAQQAKRPLSGVQIQKVGRVKLKKGDEEGIAAFRVDVGEQGLATSILVLSTALNHGDRFSRVFKRFRSALGTAISGAILIHRSSQFEMNSSTREKFDELRAARKLRFIGLDASPATFASLEALLRVLDDASNQRLVVGGLKVSSKDCQDLLARTSVLDNLDLFAALAAGLRSALSTAGSKPAMSRNNLSAKLVDTGTGPAPTATVHG